MRIPSALIAPAAFLFAATMAFAAAFWTAGVIEARSSAAVKSELLKEGITWAVVEPDGLQLRLTGTAPNEAARFRAVNLAGSIVDATRVRDRLEVTPVRAIEPPRFSVEMLRNDDGIQLIGLLPDQPGGQALAEEAAALAAGMQVTDMLETAAFPAPQGWDAALGYGLEALKLLPRSKISVAADRVAITAISDSEAQKRRLEADLRDRKPAGLVVDISISAPRPVLTPFTLRFVVDADGARFDACSADTDRARDRIITAASLAGAQGRMPCTVGLGTPSPRWAEAAEAGIRAVSELGAGSVTFSDADVTLMGDVTTSQATFDRVVGEFKAALPPAFSLKAALPPKPEAGGEGPAEFTATLGKDGQVQLRGRVTDDQLRITVDAYSKAQFRADKVYNATRVAPDLPNGWAIRVLAGLESLGELAHGDLLVRADTVEVAGVTGSQGARARISQILSSQLGQGQTFKVSVIYDERLDPLAALPTPEECMADVGEALLNGKITFAPGSAEIDASANATLNAVAEVLIRCPELELEIGAHSDSQGSEGGNKALSQARAEAVLLSLQGRRAPVGLLRAVGYGEERPIADNETEEGREANRRIEFTRIGDAPAEAAVTADQAAGPAAADAGDGAVAPDVTEDAAPGTAGVSDDPEDAVAGEPGTTEETAAAATDETTGPGTTDRPEPRPAGPDADVAAAAEGPGTTEPAAVTDTPGEDAPAETTPVAADPGEATPPPPAETDDPPSVAPAENTMRPRPRGEAP